MEVFEIETERLQLRQFRVEDAQDVFAIFSDEQLSLIHISEPTRP